MSKEGAEFNKRMKNITEEDPDLLITVDGTTYHQAPDGIGWHWSSCHSNDVWDHQGITINDSIT